ncbi:MAG: serine/threonine-protein kinase [Gemmatimonadaceae bacterium]
MNDLFSRLSLGIADRYRVERQLGSGAASAVYLAEDTRHKRYVAIKVLRPELATTVMAERFLREIEIAGQLLHPHILGIIDSGSVEGLLFYVMPFVEGESLRERLAREKELPLDEALRIVRDVADALAYAHRRGVIHRDIKPENVLLLERHALVADFGIARAIVTARQALDASRADTGRLTAPGVSLGTPAYMAPEQAAGEAEVDHRADLYALGIVAYEVLGGTPPFTGPTAQHVIAAQVGREPPPLSSLRRSVPGAVERIVMRCLAKRPADRWQSSDELIHAIDAVATGELTLQATTASPPARERFRLSEEVCRKLNRATLDPRIIGDDVHYLDNRTASDVLVIYLHGMGLDHTTFDAVLRDTPYRAMAPSMYGFAPESRRRIPLSMADHACILQEFIIDAAARTRPRMLLLVGFSSGADLGFQIIGRTAAGAQLPIDGFISLSCNLSLETCFVSQPFAALGERLAPSVSAVRNIDAHVTSLDEWVNLHEYLVTILRKFGDDLSALQRHASDVVDAFANSEDRPFERWFRDAAERVATVRCVFEDTPPQARLVQELRMRNLDRSTLGPRFRDDCIVMEPSIEHFGLMEPALIVRHLDAVLVQAERTTLVHT